MKKKLLFIMLLVVGMVPQLFAGITGKISGEVTDTDTGEPLIGANIIISGTDMGAATNEDGQYFILNVQPGTYDVTARMIGYQAVTQEGVEVSVDHTTPLNFDLESSAIAGQTVTVEAQAQRQVIKMDKSASQVSLSASDVTEVPNSTSLEDVISLQVGVDFNVRNRGGDSPADIQIRGGGRGQNAVMVDGLMMVDNRSNRPIMTVNLSSVQEINIVKGGFNAEYGNVRSGLINVVTKDPSPNAYHGSFQGRYTPATRKHFGASLYDPMNYYLRPYLDPTVSFVGTDAGWNQSDDPALQKLAGRYPDFVGWNAFAAGRPDLTPEQAQKVFIWRHMSQGKSSWDVPSAGDIGRPGGAGVYGNNPDYDLEGSFGGPVPLISEPLGNLRFFVSHRTHEDAFGLPTIRDYYTEKNTQAKITTDLSSKIKMTVEGMYSETNTISAAPRGSGLDSYTQSGLSILYSPLTAIGQYNLAQAGALYYPDAMVPFNIYRGMGGFAIDHVLSPRTFYRLRISYTRVHNRANGPHRMRDTTTLATFGGFSLDETPLGYQVGIENMFDGMETTGDGATRDYSTVNTINTRFDITSQVNQLNEVKAGFEVNYDQLDTHYEHNQPGDVGNNWVIKWKRDPYRAGAYIQDKLEFQGMIANMGLRADMNFPNSPAYTADRYSQYFRKQYMDNFQNLAPSEPAKNRIAISPRLGISHPITEDAKLYFNYGHFYSVPTSNEMFIIMKRAQGISDIGNPNAGFAKTVAYELGVEYSITDMFLIHLSGYYKDITDQLANIHYVGYDGGVDYWSQQNQNYQDIRGFEARIEKRFGRWITGWFNYDYMVTTAGYVGRQTYYEDPRLQQQEGFMNPQQDRPLARPVARGNLTVQSPADFGPTFAGMNPLGAIRMDIQYTWQAGRYESDASYRNWNPQGDVQDIAPLQWKGRTTLNLRFRKNLIMDNYSVSLFVDINNVLNLKYLEESGFESTSDRTAYMQSLHLSRYNGDAAATKAEYKEMGYTAGNDKPGDIKSKDKPYIDMPNRGFLTYFNPRTVTFGIGLNF